jgi:hypothetical protein
MKLRLRRPATASAVERAVATPRVSTRGFLRGLVGVVGAVGLAQAVDTRPVLAADQTIDGNLTVTQALGVGGAPGAIFRFEVQENNSDNMNARVRNSGTGNLYLWLNGQANYAQLMIEGTGRRTWGIGRHEGRDAISVVDWSGGAVERLRIEANGDLMVNGGAGFGRPIGVGSSSDAIYLSGTAKIAFVGAYGWNHSRIGGEDDGTIRVYGGGGFVITNGSLRMGTTVVADSGGTYYAP